MRVPLLDLQAQYASIRTEVRRALDEVLESQQFIMGPAVGDLERAMARHLGVRHAVGLSSGTDALLAAMMALELRPEDRVLVPAYSFFATAGVIARLGAVPAFVDIDPASFAMSPEALEKAWVRLPDAARSRARAIVPVHLYGQCADIAPILAFARQVGLPVIEDAAQAIGCAYRDRRQAGAMGLMGCFSFYPSKNLGAIGDAGMAVTDDDAVAERLRLLRNHGATSTYYHRIVGGNFRLDTIQAAVLLVKLRHLDAWSAARAARAGRYRELFAESGLLASGSVGLPDLVWPVPGVRTHIYHQFVVRVRRRDALRRFLSARGVGTAIYYPVPLHLQHCFADLGYKEGDFPESERAARETLALPVYPELRPDQQAYVVGCLREFYRAG